MRVTGRSREGAWIEIAVTAEEFTGQQVAPVRERGLKLHNQKYMLIKKCVAPVRERGLKFLNSRRTDEMTRSLP